VLDCCWGSTAAATILLLPQSCSYRSTLLQLLCSCYYSALASELQLACCCQAEQLLLHLELMFLNYICFRCCCLCKPNHHHFHGNEKEHLKNSKRTFNLEDVLNLLETGSSQMIPEGAAAAAAISAKNAKKKRISFPMGA
jgi:hypothetical protein